MFYWPLVREVPSTDEERRFRLPLESTRLRPLADSKDVQLFDGENNRYMGWRHPKTKRKRHLGTYSRPDMWARPHWQFTSLLTSLEKKKKNY